MQALKQELLFAINIKIQTKPIIKSISESIYSKQSYESFIPGPNSRETISGDGVEDGNDEKS